MENSYIDRLIKTCEAAKAARPKRTFTFTTLDALKPVGNAIYVIREIGGDHAKTREAFQEFKAESPRKCPKLNAHISPVLYVGSSTSSLQRRIKEHLGDGSPGTYALNLKHWFAPRRYEITIYEYNVPRDVLQIIEDSMAHDLKPMFGKMGSNGR